MIIDLVLAVVLILAVFKGLRQGLIVALFSVIAFIIGLAAAIKLSALVAGYIGKAVKISDQWLPVISFAVVFLLVVILIRLGAKAIEKTVEMAMLGWANKVGGVLLFGVLYVLIFSILIFYADQMSFITEETKKQSISYYYIQPLGPEIIDGLGKIIPFFKNMFQELETFFDSVSKQVPPAG
jgi:membrane protein required for colicin V production